MTEASFLEGGNADDGGDSGRTAEPAGVDVERSFQVGRARM